MSRRCGLRRDIPETPALEDMVRAAVRAELAHLLAALIDDVPAFYSSRRGGAPPGYSERAWKTLARRIGTKRGRWWTVTREQLAAHEQQAIPSAPTANDTDEPWSPRAALAAVGIRPTR